MRSPVYFLTSRKRNLPIERQSSILQTIISNFAFIFGAPPFILSTYRKVDRRSFAITTLTEYQVLASSALDIKAVSESSEDELSFHAAMTDVSNTMSMIILVPNDLLALEA